MSVLLNALAFARHEHAVLPLHHPITVNGRRVCSCKKGADCPAPAKHPLGRLVSRGLLDATTDMALLRRWFSDAPTANLGVRTDSLIVLDADPRHGGDQTLAALELEQPLPPTWRVLTGGGGDHVIFKCPQGVTIKSTEARQRPLLGPGIDVRAQGGYIVAPPSRHISGRSYVWSVDHHPADVPMADAPPWLIERLAEHPRTGETTPDEALPKPAENWLKITREPVTEYRDAACASFAGYLVCHLDPVVAFDILFWWNERNCRPPLEDAEVHRIWRRIVHRHAERLRAQETANA